MTVNVPMSLRGFARHVGVSDKAVRKALSAGVFSDGSVRRDATGNPSVINVTLAVTEWKRSGRQVRSGVAAPAPPSSLPPDQVVAADSPPAAVDDPHAQIAALLAQVRTLRKGVPPAAAGPLAEDALDDLSGDVESSPTLVKAQTDAMIERGRKLRMENDLREGTLVEADQAARAAFEFSRTLREAILNVPPRVAAELAAEPDASRVHMRLEAALREALTSVASILEQSAAPSAAPMEG